MNYSSVFQLKIGEKLMSNVQKKRNYWMNQCKLWINVTNQCITLTIKKKRKTILVSCFLDSYLLVIMIWRYVKSTEKGSQKLMCVLKRTNIYVYFYSNLFTQLGSTYLILLHFYYFNFPYRIMLFYLLVSYQTLDQFRLDHLHCQ